MSNTLEIKVSADAVKAAKAYEVAGGKVGALSWAVVLHYALDRMAVQGDGSVPRGYATQYGRTLAQYTADADQLLSKGWACVQRFAPSVLEGTVQRADVSALAAVLHDEFGGISTAYGALRAEQRAAQGDDEPKGGPRAKSPLELLMVAARRAKDAQLEEADFVALAAEAYRTV